MATTTNYGWTTPDNTDLVKDGALAIRTLGSAIDTTVFNNATAAAALVNKNYLINGGFAVAQRGTSFTSGSNNDDAYTLDRWYILSDGNDVIDVTQETTTVPTNGEFAIALDVETVNKKFGIATIIENKDVIGLVGKTVTFSFKAKVSATTKLDNVKAAIVAWSGTADTVTSDIISAWGAEGANPTIIANATYENSPVNLSLTTSYATYSVSAAVDTASTQNLVLFIWSDVTDTTLGDFLYIAESKLEVSSSATAFVYAGGTFQGEFAACQRYYEKHSANATATSADMGTLAYANGTTSGFSHYFYKVTKRTTPSFSSSGTFRLTDAIANNYTTTALGLNTASSNENLARIDITVASGLTSKNIYFLQSSATATSYIEFSAEL